MEFDKRKVSAMASMSSTEPDKSPKGDLDFPIVPLLTAINSHPSFFTTSSCSGRISIFSHPNTSSSAFVSKKKAKGGTWIFVSHEKVHPSSVLHLLYPSGTASDPSEANSETLPQSLVFRFEPLIIAVECKDVEAAQCLVSLAISCGFRESGITNVSKRVIVAIRCSIRLEVPLGDAGKLMVSPEYVTFLIDVANEKMEANMKRTDLFLDVLIKNGFSRTGLHMNQDRIKFPATKALESCEENRGEILQGEPESISEGSCEPLCIDLSMFEINGESVERLFLWGHSACSMDQKKVLIFGGFGGIGRHARRDDLLLLDIASGMLEIICARGAPSARLGHTASLVGGLMYVIAGRTDPLNILNDVWVFDIARKEWKFLKCSGSFFPPRHRHAAAVIGSKIYIFGGIHNDSVLSSLYALDTQTLEWTEVEVQGDGPGPVHSHSMEPNGSEIYLFGGYNGENALGNLYCFDTETRLWNNLKTNGTTPCARFSHLMFIYSNNLCILGGCPVTGLQELFLLDLQSNSWKTVMVKFIQENLFVRSTGSVIGDNLVIVGGGASCYAFGTKFNQPIKVDLLHLTSLHSSSVITGIGEKQISIHSHRIKHRSDEFADQDCEIEEPKRKSGEFVVANFWVLQLFIRYAKLVKHILKKFGWLDLERKVYAQEDKIHICVPVTENFCTMFEERHTDSKYLSSNILCLESSAFDMFVKDISCSTALDLVRACGAIKIVDEIVKIKKIPSSPFKVMKEAVTSLLKQNKLASELIEQLPSRWERLGDIVVLPVMSFEDPVWDSIGEELWPLVAQSLGAKRLARQGRVAQCETRDSKLDILVGDDGWVEHRENGIVYSFDATKCMFSRGNLSEKLRMARLVCRDQVVVDMFAGIGYFTLPFLVRANAKMVYACEWNPHAIKALHRNLVANSVADRCVLLEGDNKVTAPKGVAHRVCLGLLPSSEKSWVAAVGALRDEGGILHIHGNAKDTEETKWTDYIVRSISDIAKSQGHFWEVSVEHVERVKWYAPRIRHLVVDVRCESIQV